MWRMYCVCLLSVIVVLDLLGQSHVNRTSERVIYTMERSCVVRCVVVVVRDVSTTRRYDTPRSSCQQAQHRPDRPVESLTTRDALSIVTAHTPRPTPSHRLIQPTF